MLKKIFSIFFTFTTESTPATETEQNNEVSYNLSFNGYQLTASAFLVGSLYFIGTILF